VTTDLTDDFGLGEEEFAWDVFEPDPDDADIAAEAAALEDGDELDLDDSEFDWDAALREEPEAGAGAGADGGARAGAAYDRIVDTVRRSFEDAEPRAAIEPEPEPEPFAVHTAETPPAAESGPEVESFAFAPEAEAELQQGLWLPETELWLEADPEPEEESGWDLEPKLEPAEARIAAMAATVAGLEAAESSPVAPSEAEAAGSEEDAPHDDAGEAASTGSPAPPTRTSRTKKRHERNRRSRVFTTTVVLACLVLVFVAAVAIAHARHHPTTATTTGRTPAHAVPPTSSATETARIQTATDALDSATTSATVGISSLATFPTPSNVEKVINPYMSSLQLFGTLLAGSTVPAAARPAASSAEAQVRQDLQFLDTIEALPPLQLGSFLKQFDADATQLQTTLSALEQNLRAATS
jgi:hypothetical protein